MTDEERILELIEDWSWCKWDIYRSCDGCEYEDDRNCRNKRLAKHLADSGLTFANEALCAVAELVFQFGYSTTYYGKDAVCDGGLSALEIAFSVLEKAGCKMNANGTIQESNLLRFLEEMDKK